MALTNKAMLATILCSRHHLLTIYQSLIDYVVQSRPSTQSAALRDHRQMTFGASSTASDSVLSASVPTR
jgi:hypothetical protein